MTSSVGNVGNATMLMYKCDYCGAAPYVWCRSRFSHPPVRATYLHSDRFYKATRAGSFPIKEKETVMARNRTLLEAQAKVILEQLTRYEMLDAKFGAEDDYPIDTVLSFDRVWNEDPRPEFAGRRYEFVALKVSNGQWYVTKGDRSRMGSPFTWDELKEFMRSSTKLYYASEWTAVFDDGK